MENNKDQVTVSDKIFVYALDSLLIVWFIVLVIDTIRHW
jgi:hypothetical protein